MSGENSQTLTHEWQLNGGNIVVGSIHQLETFSKEDTVKWALTFQPSTTYVFINADELQKLRDENERLKNALREIASKAIEESNA